MPITFARISNTLPRLRALLVVVLALFLVMMGTPQSRTAVVINQSENGVPRIYETEVHHASPSVMTQSLIKLGRKPFERLILSEPRPMLAQAAPAGPEHSPRSPRAPPHQPRAPPILVS